MEKKKKKKLPYMAPVVAQFRSTNESPMRHLVLFAVVVIFAISTASVSGEEECDGCYSAPAVKNSLKATGDFAGGRQLRVADVDVPSDAPVFKNGPPRIPTRSPRKPPPPRPRAPPPPHCGDHCDIFVPNPDSPPPYCSRASSATVASRSFFGLLLMVIVIATRGDFPMRLLVLLALISTISMTSTVSGTDRGCYSTTSPLIKATSNFAGGRQLLDEDVIPSDDPDCKRRALPPPHGLIPTPSPTHKPPPLRQPRVPAPSNLGAPDVVPTSDCSPPASSPPNTSPSLGATDPFLVSVAAGAGLLLLLV